MRPIWRQGDVNALALVATDNVKLSLPWLIAGQGGAKRIGPRFERQRFAGRYPKWEVVQCEGGASWHSRYVDAARQGCEADIQLLGVGVIYRNGLPIGVVSLCRNG